MTEKNKLKTPEEVLGKPLNEMIEEDALTLALAFELDGISPERFWEQDNQSQHDYAQRILDFFQITAKKLVIGLFNPETEIATAALQVKMSKLKAKSPRPRPGIMKEHIKEFEILELAFELWLERSPQVANPDDIEQPIPKELLKQLFRRGTVPNRDIYSVTGNSTGRFKDAEIAVIDRFCPIRAIIWQEFLKLPISVQKLYLTRVVNFFKTTWGDIAKYWFKGTVSTTTLEQVVKNLDIQRDQIICNRDIVKAIKQCAKREAFVRNNAEAPTPADNEAPTERTETSETENTAPAEETMEPEIANEPSTPPPRTIRRRIVPRERRRKPTLRKFRRSRKATQLCSRPARLSSIGTSSRSTTVRRNPNRKPIPKRYWLNCRFARLPILERLIRSTP